MKLNNTKKKIVIVGATSGIGYETALLYIQEGWTVGVAGRRADLLEKIQKIAPQHIFTQPIDFTQPDAPEKLMQLIERMGGMDIYLHSSGVGYQNYALNCQTEMQTVETNVAGFTRMATSVFHYFMNQGHGQLAVISSIAGTKGLGIAPAYSATKRFQNTYMDALEQLACMKKANIHFTDIRPGFVATALLNNGKHYPLMMRPKAVAFNIKKALEKRKRVVIIDWKYQLIVAVWKLIPRLIWKRLRVKN